MSRKPKVQDVDHSILDTIHSHDIDPVNFHIYLTGREDSRDEMEMGEPGVEFRLANRFIRNLDYLTMLDQTRPILISMKTCGGYVHEGLAIYDAIMAAPNPVTMINYTHARSMSSIIFQAANKRIMMPNSYLMIHEGEMEITGTIKQTKSAYEFEERITKNWFHMYLERMSTTEGASIVKDWTEEQIQKWLLSQMNDKEDVYLLAQEAVDYGLADEVFCDWDTIFRYTKQQLSIKC